VVVYNSGQVQRISQVERKNKCSKKTTEGDIAVLWTALLLLLQSYILLFAFVMLFLFRKVLDSSGCLFACFILLFICYDFFIDFFCQIAQATLANVV